MISIIAAMDEKRGIGKNNSIPWHIPEDFARVKNLTSGHPIIMGRRTYESIGRILPNRTNIIITTDPELDIENAIIVSSLEMALEAATDSEGNDEIFIFGGGKVFKEAMERGIVDKLYLTIVEGDFGADTFFPDYANAGFKKISEEEHETHSASSGQDGKYKFKFIYLQKQTL